MQIGELAERTGFSRDTIRYYERLGLLARTDTRRRANNYRDYGPHALARLSWIRTLKGHGFSLNEIRTLAPRLEQAESCDGMPEVLADKLADIDARIRELEGFRGRLREALASCRGQACERPPRSPAHEADGADPAQAGRARPS